MTKEKEPVKFEEALGRLEAIVKSLEDGGLPLEKSIETFEEGVKLADLCQKLLDKAEKKVEMLVKGGDGALKTVPFEEAAPNP